MKWENRRNNYSKRLFCAPLLMVFLSCFFILSGLFNKKAFAAKEDATWHNHPTATLYRAYRVNDVYTWDSNYGQWATPMTILQKGSGKALLGFRWHEVPIQGPFASYNTIYVKTTLRGGSGAFPNPGKFDDIVFLVVDTEDNEYRSTNCNYYYNSATSVSWECSVNLPKDKIPDTFNLRVGSISSSTWDMISLANATNGDLVLDYFGYGVEQVADPSAAYLSQITEQNQTIINQNNQIIQEQQEANNIAQETQDYITDDTAPDADTDNLPSVGLLPAGPLDSLLGLPLTLMTNISNALGGSCTGLNIPLPYINGNLTIPCFDTIFYSGNFAPLANVIGGAASAVILYYWLKHLYKKVDRAISMETTDEDTWGVL